MIYAASNINDKVKSNSSSGGIYPLLAEYVISNSGIVFASVYEGTAVKYISVDSIEDIPGTQGSKYAPSDLQDTFIHIKEALNKGREVLFVGLPCHCAGLRTYLRKPYDRLLIMGIVCHGIPSPKALQYYLNERNAHSVNMRDKRNGWSNYIWKLGCADGEMIIHHDKVSFMDGFLGDLYLRPCCYECRFKNRTDALAADLIVGDFWGIDSIRPELFDDSGVSIVITNSDRGQSVLDSIRDRLNISAVDGEEYKNHNHGFSIPPLNDNRDAFFAGIKNGECFDELVYRLLKP